MSIHYFKVGIVSKKKKRRCLTHSFVLLFITCMYRRCDNLPHLIMPPIKEPELSIWLMLLCEYFNYSSHKEPRETAKYESPDQKKGLLQMFNFLIRAFDTWRSTSRPWGWLIWMNEPGVIRRRVSMVSCQGNQFIWSQASLAGDLQRFFLKNTSLFFRFLLFEQAAVQLIKCYQSYGPIEKYQISDSRSTKCSHLPL